MSIEYCHFCEKHIDTDFDMDHGHISEAEIERYYTTREMLPEDYQNHLDQYAPSIEQPSLIDFDNEQIPF